MAHRRAFRVRSLPAGGVTRAQTAARSTTRKRSAALKTTGQMSPVATAAGTRALLEVRPQTACRGAILAEFAMVVVQTRSASTRVRRYLPALPCSALLCLQCPRKPAAIQTSNASARRGPSFATPVVRNSIIAHVVQRPAFYPPEQPLRCRPARRP